MRLMYFLLLVSLLVGSTFAEVTDASGNHDPTCNCAHCDEIKVMTIEESELQANNTEDGDEAETGNEEDADGDGDRTICARDRDEPDRTFPSICHMLCSNDCTRYRVWIYVENKQKKYRASAYRSNYYKLWDGPC